MAEYDGSATISLSRTPRATDSEDEDGPRRTISLASGGAAGVGGGNGDSPATGSALSAPRKPRGRPPGSKNKPKPPVVITRESESAMRPVVLELAAGADVLECVSGFARQRRVGVSIISGSGPVTNVTLRHPASHPTSLTLHGRFDILSLAGTFLPTKLSSPSSSPAPVVKSPFTVSLAGAQGQVIGGAVTGNLIAAGPVVLLVATFGSPEFHRLPAPCAEEEEGDTAAGVAAAEESRPLVAVSNEPPVSSGGMSYGSGGGGGGGSISCQMPVEVLPWTGHAERATGSHFRHPHHHY